MMVQLGVFTRVNYMYWIHELNVQVQCLIICPEPYFAVDMVKWARVNMELIFRFIYEFTYFQNKNKANILRFI